MLRFSLLVQLLCHFFKNFEIDVNDQLITRLPNFYLNKLGIDESAVVNQHPPAIPQSEMKKLLRQVLLTPGKTGSFSVLSQKGIFRKLFMDTDRQPRFTDGKLPLPSVPSVPMDKVFEGYLMLLQ